MTTTARIIGCALGALVLSAGIAAGQPDVKFSVTDTIPNEDKTILSTKQNEVVHVEAINVDDQSKYNFDVMYGPYPQNKLGHGRDTGRATLHSSGISPSNPVAGADLPNPPSWEMHGGYSFSMGYWPPVWTRRVAAGALGTTMALRADDAADTIVVLRNHVSSKEAASTNKVEIFDRDTYKKLQTIDLSKFPDAQGAYCIAYEVDGEVHVTQPKALSDNPEDTVRQFVDYATARAKAGGLYKYTGGDS